MQLCRDHGAIPFQVLTSTDLPTPGHGAGGTQGVVVAEIKRLRQERDRYCSLHEGSQLVPNAPQTTQLPSPSVSSEEAEAATAQINSSMQKASDCAMGTLEKRYWPHSPPRVTRL